MDTAKLLKTKNTLILVVIIMLAIAISWYSTEPGKNLVEADALRGSPDYFVTEVQIKEFDKSGTLIESMNAKQTFHYDLQDKTFLEQPSVARYSESGQWNAKADKGVIEDGSNDILLTDNVRATKKYQQSEDINLSSDNMHYEDKNKSLTSYGAATLISTQGKTSASKITTYINSEEVVMTGSVRGSYETIH
ncbi:MAG: LPS export ABC transporter periplasmic protein LptC [Marinomonas foliarum]|jgi:lipopolysaccharide export system protein LptC|uniref:LPS export ABC transporter periplasmic protein LptC n=1 Tax=Marinomonas foliarum TaxID=491950 RepID=A0A368ZQG0_9GAMM|nr:LPS export ABC transporter periplasmic protein LptC [Marinomonas foliarum]QRV24247.1 LPS export ABC transporter periplasmic protein LptC [Marinomonas foliarum]RCW98236.1 lipopolysaccharide export system protein LptC [Marinomonas foliarum]